MVAPGFRTLFSRHEAAWRALAEAAAGVAALPLETWRALVQGPSGKGAPATTPPAPPATVDDEAMLALKLSLYRDLEPLLTQLPLARHALENGGAIAPTDLLTLWEPLETALERLGFSPIGSVGEVVPFDPSRHQARAPLPAEGEPVRVKQVGYRLENRLLSRARVIRGEI